MTYGASTVDRRSFDDWGRITRQNLGSELDVGYKYGADGNTREVKMTGAWHSDSLATTLDVGGRVVGEALTVPSTGLQTQQSFVLDSANNWLRVKSGIKWLETAPDASHAYATAPDGSARYDQDGRQTKAGDTTYRYDAFGRLAEVKTRTATCTYDYDALGRRIRELCNGKETLFGYSGDNLVVEQQGTTATATIHAGLSAPVARVPLRDPTQRMYIVPGKDGSVRAMLNSAGAVVETYSYTALGETTIRQKPKQAPTGNRFGFQGAYQDPNTGLYQMRARYYAPRWGRFLTPDPLGVAATGNPYAFVGNRPGDFWDPFGLSPVANPNDGQSMSLDNPFSNDRDPVAHWLLYSDNFVTNTLQDDSNLKYAQNGVLIATGSAEAGIVTYATAGSAAAAFTAAGAMPAVRMGLIRAGMMTEDAAAAFAGNTGTTAGRVEVVGYGLRKKRWSLWGVVGEDLRVVVAGARSFTARTLRQLRALQRTGSTGLPRQSWEAEMSSGWQKSLIRPGSLLRSTPLAVRRQSLGFGFRRPLLIRSWPGEYCNSTAKRELGKLWIGAPSILWHPSSEWNDNDCEVS